MKANFFRIIIFLLLIITVDATVSYAESIDTLKIKAEVDSLIDMGDSLRKSWHLEGAIETYRLGLGRAQIIDYRDRIAYLSNKIGMVHMYRSEYDDALTHWENALKIFRELGLRTSENTVLGNIGAVYTIRSDYPKAIECYQQSMDACREIGFREGEGRAVGNLGNVFLETTDYTKALKCYQQGLEIFRELGLRSEEAHMLLNIGGIYVYLGDYKDSEEYYHKSLDISLEVGDSRIVSSALLNLGVLCARLSNFSKALDFYQQALERSRELGDRQREGEILLDLGQAYHELGDYQKALELMESAKAIFRDLDYGVGTVRTLNAMGVNYRVMGNFSQAVVDLQKGLRMAEELKCENEIGEAYYQLGKCYDLQEMDSSAAVHFASSIDALEKIRGKLEVEEQKSGYAKGIFNNYEAMIVTLLRLGKNEEAYNYTERGRARSFLDLLASGEVTVGKSRHAEFLQKEEEYHKHEVDTEKQIAAVPDDTVQVALLRGRLEEEWESIDAKIEEKKMYEPELASMVTVNPLTLPEVQALMDPKSTILEYFLTKEKTLIWLITRDDMEVFQVVVGGDSLATLVKDFRDAILTEGLVEGRSQALYEILIAPAEDKIETEQLVIIPHGILHYLPFHALQNRKGNYLIDHYNISYLPSASVLKYLEPKKRPKGDKLLAFGNPTTNRDDCKTLPFAERELNDIAQFYEQKLLLSEVDATEDKFRELAPDYDIIHLACHSELNSAYPLYSGLLLAPGEKQDGELDVHELFTMDLNAYLVVLSACQTGLGHLTTGDELVGLSRAFIYAGTPSVVSSLWVVKDESTAYLMTQFHKNLRKYDKAEALRRAQLQTRNKYKSPYHWAAFVLIGSSD